MILGINSVALSGCVEWAKEGRLPSGKRCWNICLLVRRSGRSAHASPIVCRVKINVYGAVLIEQCAAALATAQGAGVYTVVEGELMNRFGQYEELLEVRAARLVFPTCEEST